MPRKRALGKSFLLGALPTLVKSNIADIQILSSMLHYTLYPINKPLQNPKTIVFRSCALPLDRIFVLPRCTLKCTENTVINM